MHFIIYKGSYIICAIHRHMSPLPTWILSREKDYLLNINIKLYLSVSKEIILSLSNIKKTKVSTGNNTRDICHLLLHEIQKDLKLLLINQH